MCSVRNSWATIIYCTGQFSMIWLYYKVLPAHRWPLSLSGESASMAMTYPLSQTLDYKPPNVLKIRSSSEIDGTKPHITQLQTKKRCLRCNTLYLDKDNSPIACSFHGHTTGMQLCIFLLTNLLKVPCLPFLYGSLMLATFCAGEKGLFSLSPPHQGIDGEWSDRSGVIVYKWNDKNNRPNTGSVIWKKRWSCCAEYDENASPCRRGWHVSYDDGFTLY